MNTEENYDSYDLYNRSDRLEPVKINYKPSPTPPPFVPDSTSSSSPSPESRGSDSDLARDFSNQPRRIKKKRRKQRHKPSQGDTVLLTFLDPNRPDIAQDASHNALNSASQSEVEDEVEEERREEQPMGFAPTPVTGISNVPSGGPLVTAASAALGLVPGEEDVDMRGVQQSRHEHKLDFPNTNGTMNGVVDHHHEKCVSRTVRDRDAALSTMPGLDIKPPPRLPRPVISTHSPVSGNKRNHDEDTPISPGLAKYAMRPSEADAENILPAMQNSPPRSDSMHSPDGSQTQSLPSLQTTLSQINEPGMNGIHGFPPPSGQSPKFVRHSPHPSQGFGPSPASYSQPSPNMSPPGVYPNHPNFWRTAPRRESMSTASTYEASTPVSASNPSPAQSYPTPNVQDHQSSVDETPTPQLINGPLSANGPLGSSAFKCIYPGCTAAPFQTQYLLNSHANVHSSSRPHFCPEVGCARGPGGKGFKRKNEMIRHGLVHQSPGYIWYVVREFYLPKSY